MGYDETEIDIPVAIASPIVESEAVQQDQSANAPTVLTSLSDPSRAPILGDHEIETLKAQGFPMGLIHAMHRNAQDFLMRIWLVDNTEGMNKGGGHRIAESESAKDVQLVMCSSWSELQQTVEYHAQMSALLKAPTVFRLFNDPGIAVGPQQFSIGERGEICIPEDLEIALRTVRQATPSGHSRLSQHLVDVRQNIMDMLPQLQATGKKVAIILATNGLPTGENGESDSGARAEFENVLRSLAVLPVRVIVRVCSDEASVLEYYNNSNRQLELRMKVLDDWVRESRQISNHNPWLNYGIALHRMREMGFNNHLLDVLDQRRLHMEELKDFFEILFGQDAFDGAPDPNLDYNNFLVHVKLAAYRAGKTWDPSLQQMGPWVNPVLLNISFCMCCVIL